MGTPGQGEVPVASGNGNCSSSNSYNHTSVNTTGMGKQSVSGSTVAVVKVCVEYSWCEGMCGIQLV